MKNKMGEVQEAAARCAASRMLASHRSSPATPTAASCDMHQGADATRSEEEEERRIRRRGNGSRRPIRRQRRCWPATGPLQPLQRRPPGTYPEGETESGREEGSALGGSQGVSAFLFRVSHLYHVLVVFHVSVLVLVLLLGLAFHPLP